MPNKDSLSSGFVGEDIPSQESMFSNISEFYRSESGYSCLHLCRRYGKLHILKSLQPPFKQEEFYKQLLHKEFNIGYQLDHPNIRQTIDWEQQDELGLCIVMEYIDGISLKEFMIQGKLTQPLAYKFIRELCEALHYIHSKQLVHKDLKPENIIITHNGNNVKLIDFGLSDRDDYDTLKIPAGTKKYLAPEQLLPHASLDCRTDIYSLGVIIQDITSVIKDRKLVRIAQKCTQKNPDKRFHSAQEVLEALNVRRHSKSILYISTVAVLSFLTTFYLKNLSSQPDKSSINRVYSNSVIAPTCQKFLLQEKNNLNRHVIAYKKDERSLVQDSTNTQKALKQIIKTEFADATQQESRLFKHQVNELESEIGQIFDNIRKEMQ